MRMNLVKENGLEREYYFGRKRNMVSYYKYRWNDEAKKYLPFYNKTFKAFEGLEQFEKSMREKGFVSIAELETKKFN